MLNIKKTNNDKYDYYYIIGDIEIIETMDDYRRFQKEVISTSLIVVKLFHLKVKLITKDHDYVNIEDKHGVGKVFRILDPDFVPTLVGNCVISLVSQKDEILRWVYDTSSKTNLTNIDDIEEIFK